MLTTELNKLCQHALFMRKLQSCAITFLTNYGVLDYIILWCVGLLNIIATTKLCLRVYWTSTILCVCSNKGWWTEPNSVCVPPSTRSSSCAGASLWTWCTSVRRSTSALVWATSAVGRRSCKKELWVASGQYCFKMVAVACGPASKQAQTRQWILLASSDHAARCLRLRWQTVTRRGF